jgi:hypothetical protein
MIKAIFILVISTLSPELFAWSNLKYFPEKEKINSTEVFQEIAQKNNRQLLLGKYQPEEDDDEEEMEYLILDKKKKVVLIRDQDLGLLFDKASDFGLTQEEGRFFYLEQIKSQIKEPDQKSKFIYGLEFKKKHSKITPREAWLLEQLKSAF